MWGCSSLGRALPWHGRGNEFDPRQLHHKTETSFITYTYEGFFYNGNNVKIKYANFISVNAYTFY